MKKRSVLNKNFYVSVLLALCFVFACFAFVGINSNQKANKIFAEEVLPDSQVIKQGNGIMEIPDQRLYDALFACLSVGNDQLTVGSFRGRTSLNLSYNSVGMKISSLKGLELFKFDNLTELNLSGNLINDEISNLSNLANVQRLNLSNNIIKNFNASNFPKLVQLNLSNNKLENCNLSAIFNDASIDLSSNKISSFDNLTLPNNASTILLHQNYISSVAPTTTCEIFLGLQGVKNGEKIEKNQNIVFRNLNGVTSVGLYKKINESFSFVKEYTEGESISIQNYGDYKIVFNGNPEFLDVVFEIKPVKPSYEIYNESGTLLVKKFEYKSNCEIVLGGEGTVFYKIDDQEQAQGTKINLNTNGTYYISFWQMIDGYSSEVVKISIKINVFNPLTMVWLLLGIVAFVGLFFFALKWKDFLLNPKKKKGIFSSKNFE